MATLPLTGAQLGIWLAQQRDPASTAYATAELIELEGDLDPAAFVAAVRAVLDDAPALHARFSEGPDGPQQEPAAPRDWEHPYLDLASEPDPLSAAARWVDADLARPTDLSTGPLLRGALLRVGAQRWRWYLYLHHLVTDGYSSALLLRRIADRVRTGQSAPVEGLGALLADERTYLASDAPAADRAFWQERLAAHGSPPTVAGRHAPPAARPNRATTLVESPTTLAAVASAHGRAWPELAGAAVLAWLASMTGEPEQVIALPILGRTGAARKAPGARVNLLPVRVAVQDDATFGALVDAFAREMAAIRPHGRLRFEELARLVPGGAPLFGAELNVKPFATDLDFGTARGTVHNLVAGPVDDLAVQLMADAAGQVRVTLDANPALYSSAVTASLAAGLAQTLAACTADGAWGAPVGALPTIGEADRRLVLDRWNRTDHPLPSSGNTLADGLRAAASAHLTKPALADAEETIDYRELRLRAEALGEALRAHGAGPGAIVGLALRRANALPIATSATLLEGAAYLPLDPDLPADRLAYMAELAQPACVVATADTAPTVPAGVPIVLVDRGGRLVEPEQSSPPLPSAIAAAAARPIRRPADPVAPTPANAAYLLFTSGSTGRPKGVLVEHGAIVNRLAWMQAAMPIGPADTVLQKTPYGFDVSVWELVWPLLRGARLVSAPPGAHRDPGELAALIEREGVTVAHFVPSMFDLFLAHPAAARCTSLRRIVCSGEALGGATAQRVRELLPDATLENLYGPTEAAVDVTRWPCSEADDAGPVPIGRPIWNTRTYVLDPAGRPVPPGVSGELWLGGVQLAREYVGRPDLTEAAFRPDPFAAPADRDFAGRAPRMYRTGDLARWRPDGAIDYLGRRDTQVKLGGVRIELGEIEAVLGTHRAVRQAAAAIDGSGPAPRLVAYVVPAGERDQIDAASLRAHASAQLLPAMVPAAIVVVPELPVTANGKLDRRALAALAPPAALDSAAPAGGRTPATPREAELCSLFAEALGRPDFGADEHLFEAGVDSLLAVRLAARIRERAGVELSVGALFAAPTPARLAERIDGGHDPSALEPMLTLSDASDPGRTGDPIFCLHPAGGLGWCYEGLARVIADRPIVAVQSPALRGEPLPADLPDLAARYAAQITEGQPHGPLHLLGWSVGGVLAHEVAAQLSAQGREIGLLALLDAYPGAQWRHLEPPTTADTSRALLHMAGLDETALRGAPLALEPVRAALEAAGSPLAALGERTLERVRRTVLGCTEAMRAHDPAVALGDAVLFRAAAPRPEDWLDATAWAAYLTGELEIVDIDCTHPQMPRRGPIDAIGAHLAQRLAVGTRAGTAGSR